MTLDNKVKILALAAFFLVSLALFYYFFYAPRSAEQERLQGEISAVQAKIDKAKVVIANRAQYQADLEEAQRKFDETAVSRWNPCGGFQRAACRWKNF